MSISPVVKAPEGSYSEKDECAICRVPLNPSLKHRLGSIVIHDNDNGAKHPMHQVCLKAWLVGKNRFATGRGNCPNCRDEISWPKPRDSLFERIIGMSTLIVITGTAHATFSYLSGRPILVATMPSVFTSLMSIEALWLEHKELGLQRSLGVELGINLATSAYVIGVPALASIAASQITESVIPHSFITAIFGVIGLAPFTLEFLDDIS